MIDILSIQIDILSIILSMIFLVILVQLDLVTLKREKKLILIAKLAEAILIDTYLYIYHMYF